MQERDRTLGALARGGVDQLEAVDLEAHERLGEVGHLETHVVEALALRIEEAIDAGRVVSGLDELDLRLADTQERDADPVLGDVHDRLELETQHVPPELKGRLDRADDERHVVDLPQPPDVLGHGRIGPVSRSAHDAAPIRTIRTSGAAPNAARCSAAEAKISRAVDTLAGSAAARRSASSQTTRVARSSGGSG